MITSLLANKGTTVNVTRVLEVYLTSTGVAQRFLAQSAIFRIASMALVLRGLFRIRAGTVSSVMSSV